MARNSISTLSVTRKGFHISGVSVHENHMKKVYKRKGLGDSSISTFVKAGDFA